MLKCQNGFYTIRYIYIQEISVLFSGVCAQALLFKFDEKEKQQQQPGITWRQKKKTYRKSLKLNWKLLFYSTM